ncbi:MAG: hypothetical protein ACTTKH_05365 [Treponema sp.]
MYFYKKYILIHLFFITFPIFFFAEESPVGVFSLEECKESLIKFYKSETIDDVALATSAEKLENIIFSSLKNYDIQKDKNTQNDFLEEAFLLYLEHTYVISSIYDIGGMNEYFELIKKLKHNAELFMNAIKPNAKIYLKYADLLYLSLAQGNTKAIHALPIIYRKVLLLDKENTEALVKLSLWYISPANENTSNFNGLIEYAENFIEELEPIDLFNACLWYSIYYMKNYNEKKAFAYLQRANKIFPHHIYIAHLWNNYKNGIFKM